MEDLLQVGVISSTHGIRGEVKVFPTTDNPNRFKKLKEVLLDTGKEQIPLEIEQVKFFKNMVIIKFKGIDHINDVEKYRNKSLFVTRENAVRLEKNEYFVADLIGIEAKDEQEKHLGKITDVIQTGANDVYVITTDDKKEILVPAIKDCIIEICIEENYIKIHLLPGLLDMNDK